MNNENTGYNGWKNYETWLVALWLDNEQASYKLMRENAVESINNVLLEEPEFEYDGNNKDQLIRSASYKLSNVIKEYLEDRNPLRETASVYADLLNSAISKADFTEIAEHYLDDETFEEAIEFWDFDVFYGRDLP